MTFFCYRKSTVDTAVKRTHYYENEEDTANSQVPGSEINIINIDSQEDTDLNAKPSEDLNDIMNQNEDYKNPTKVSTNLNNPVSQTSQTSGVETSEVAPKVPDNQRSISIVSLVEEQDKVVENYLAEQGDNVVETYLSEQDNVVETDRSKEQEMGAESEMQTDEEKDSELQEALRKDKPVFGIIRFIVIFFHHLKKKKNTKKVLIGASTNSVCLHRTLCNSTMCYFTSILLVLKYS